MKSYKLADNILLLLFDDIIEAQKSLKRLQLVQEAKGFSKANFHQALPKAIEDCKGFNISKATIDKFFDKTYLISKEERAAFERTKNFKENFAVIGLIDDGEFSDMRILKHELAHAFFTISLDYRNKVSKIIKEGLKNNIFTTQKNSLNELHYYRKSSIIDELQAYLISDRLLFEDKTNINHLNRLQIEFDIVLKQLNLDKLFIKVSNK